MANPNETMERVTFRIPSGQLKRVDRLVNRGEYPNRSEALRQYIRDGVKADEADEDGRPQPLALNTSGDD